jgi:hypothetical protein
VNPVHTSYRIETSITRKTPECWRTPAERFDGTPFLDRGFEHLPSLAAVAPLLAELLAA